METKQITLQLPQTEVSFLEEYTRRHKTTIAQLFDSYIRQLQQREENTSFSAVDAELEEHSGIIPSKIDAEREYYEALEEKHR